MSNTQFPDGLPAGYKILWYEIVNVLGQGGFGITYLAKDTNLDQLVAIKEYLPQEIAVRQEGTTLAPKTPEHQKAFDWGLSRFLQEAQTLARFKHPNIVRVLSFFRDGTTALFVMEYEEGKSFSSILKRQRTLPEQQIMKLLLPLLGGLERLHEMGFVHRDIKPANIFVRKDSSPVLIDFGSARQALGNQGGQMTSMVSLGYAPFEQYETDSNRQGAWTDIYAMGGVLYRAVTGKRPVEATLRISAKMRDEPDPLIPASKVSGNNYSPQLLAAIDKALQVLEKDRPQSIAEWQTLLVGQEGASPGISYLGGADEDADATQLISPDEVPPTATPTAAPKQPEPEPESQPQVKKKKKNNWRSFVNSIGLGKSKPPARKAAPKAGMKKRSPVLSQMAAKQKQEEDAQDPDDPFVDIFVNGDREKVHCSQLKGGEIWIEPITKMEFVWIPAGAFAMGCSNKEPGYREGEGPVHKVELDGFWMGKYPVTYSAWNAVMKTSSMNDPGPNYPIESVLWDDTQKFIQKLSRMSGSRNLFRLPTEAQWEFAARSGTTTPYHFGEFDPDWLDHYAWYITNAGSGTHPVGEKEPNPWGLYDMMGNVWEWVNDWYAVDYYKDGPVRNPRGAPSGATRVRRGGSWRSKEYACRSAHRNRVAVQAANNTLGFRLLRLDKDQMFSDRKRMRSIQGTPT